MQYQTLCQLAFEACVGERCRVPTLVWRLPRIAAYYANLPDCALQSECNVHCGRPAAVITTLLKSWLSREPYDLARTAPSSVRLRVGRRGRIAGLLRQRARAIISFLAASARASRYSAKSARWTPLALFSGLCSDPSSVVCAYRREIARCWNRQGGWRNWLVRLPLIRRRADLPGCAVLYRPRFLGFWPGNALPNAITSISPQS